MKKYKDESKNELISIIENKNKTICKLNGKVYYLKKINEYYKNKKVRVK